MRSLANKIKVEGIPAELEEILNSVSQDEEPFLTLTDATGKTFPVSKENIDIAAIAVIYNGKVAELGNLEKEVGHQTNLVGHELSMIAALSGYNAVINNTLTSIQVSISPEVPYMLLIKDMVKIKEVTGIEVPQSLIDDVYSAMAQWQNSFQVYHYALEFAIRFGKPSESVALMLYEAVCSMDKSKSIKRVSQLQQHYGFAAKIDQREVTVEEFVAYAFKRIKEQSERKNLPKIARLTAESAIGRAAFSNGQLGLSTADIGEVARYDKNRFIVLMQMQSDLLQKPSDYDDENMRTILDFYDAAVRHNIQLPNQLKGLIPYHIVIPLVRIPHNIWSGIGSRFNKRIAYANSTLDKLIESGLYSIDTKTFSDAFDVALNHLFEDYLTHGLQGAAKFTHLYGSKNAVSRISSLAGHFGVDLSETSRRYIRKINDAFSQYQEARASHFV